MTGKHKTRVLAALLACIATAPAAAQTFTNPLGSEPDPKILYQGGNYYTVQGGGAYTYVFQSSSLGTLLTEKAPTIIVNSGDTRNWAPEIHYLNNKFYIYAAVDSGIRVMEATSASGPWTTKAVLGSGGWIDPSILQLSDGTLYLLFSNYPSISIIKLSDPWTTTGGSTQLSSPTLSWEGNVNENPSAIIHNNTVYVTYSANAWNTGNYAVGMLSAPLSSDLLSASSYAKSSNPVFASSSANGVYGPGGQCFFKSPDGTEDWFCYHAWAASNGEAGGVPRSVRAQKFTWNSDGSPNLGTPVASGTAITLPAGDPGSGSQNYALNKTVIASSEYAAFHAATKAVDGSIGSSDSGGWAPTDDDAQPWFWLDLGQPRTLSSIELVTRQGSSGCTCDFPASRRNFEIRGSNLSPMTSYDVLGTQGSTPIGYLGMGTYSVSGSQTYRYIAVVKTVPEYFFIAELRALGGSAPNLAQGKATTSSSDYSSVYSAAMATDGQYLSNWAANDTSQPWLQIDLGSAQAIGRIDVVPRIEADQDVTRRNFEIWASNDASMATHVTLGSVGSTGIGFGATYTATVSDTTPYRYIRVRKSVASEWFSLSEVKVFGK